MRWTGSHVTKVACYIPDHMMNSTGFILNSSAIIQGSPLSICATSVLCLGEYRKLTVVTLVPRDNAWNNWSPLWSPWCTLIVARYY